MDNKTKLLFIIPSLETGGSQKVLSILLNYISKDKFDTTVCVLTETGAFYDCIPDSVKKGHLHTKRVRFSAPKIYSFIKQSKPDVVFVFDVNNLSLIVGLVSFFLPSKIKYITRESTIVSVFINGYAYLKSIRRMLYRFTFKRYDLIVCQAEFMKNDLIKNFNVRPDKISVINNPLESDKLLQAAVSEDIHAKENTLNIVAVGRIVHVKGYDLMMKALSLVRTPHFHLTVLGDATPENPGYKEEVLNLVEKNNLKNKISFLGFDTNPYKYMRKSDLLIISSRYEGFPNVALEANIFGTPVLAFNSPGGVGEIITEGVNGWLVENGNVEQLAQAIDRISGLKINRTAISDRTKEKYDVSKIVPAYEQTILHLMQKK